MWLHGEQGMALLVEDDQEVTLSGDDPQAGTVLLRPVTTAALLAACGFTEGPGAVRLSDPAAFEPVQRDERWVRVDELDQDGRIGGHTPLFLRQVLASLDPRQPVPPTVTWRQDDSPSCRCGCGRHAAGAADIAEAQVPAAAVRTEVTVEVPRFLRAGTAVIMPKVVPDIVVGVGATLTIAANVPHLLIGNLLCYRRSRIRQESQHLSVDATGTVQGSIPEYVHQVVGDRLELNLDRLRELPRLPV
ncbi:hypothetical protein ACFYVL_33970 [Streptomyces sp. NPDC004111]|uniref:hypothetical protein n=1 Tax=Streptomyces sp. NPDC004111 TaxID=3364690 RepID=UPI0036ADC6EE